MPHVTAPVGENNNHYCKEVPNPRLPVKLTDNNTAEKRSPTDPKQVPQNRTLQID